ncbi:MAG TPA: hypothetical protein VI997_12015 [Candidatus Thermoplasmatota archaeon]|nr:hypothetical protein [Candidatus Thermoplasmatota archaeon]
MNHRAYALFLFFLFAFTALPAPVAAQGSYTPLTAAEWSHFMTLCADFLQWHLAGSGGSVTQPFIQSAAGRIGAGGATMS